MSMPAASRISPDDRTAVGRIEIVPEHFPVHCPAADRVYETLDPGIRSDGTAYDGRAIRQDGVLYATEAYVARHFRRAA